MAVSDVRSLAGLGGIKGHIERFCLEAGLPFVYNEGIK